MTRPASPSKLVLLEDRRGGAELAGPAVVRRYRLARLSFEPASPPERRFEYLRRGHD